MPQATDELRARMKHYYGDPIDDGPPTRFLEAHGFTFTRGGLIEPPAHKLNVDSRRYDLSRQEWESMLFLCDEWDYGWEFISHIPEGCTS